MNNKHIIEKYLINRGSKNDLPINENIQVKITTLLEHVTQKHSKLLPVRFDVHYPSDIQSSGTNKDISKMMAKLVKKYKRQGLDPYYFWVREQENSHNPHYHCALFLNGHKVYKYNHVFRNAEKLWEKTIANDSDGLIHHCTKGKDDKEHQNGIRLDRSAPDFTDKFNEVHYQTSYCSKASQKSESNDGLRNIGMSRIGRNSK